MKNLPINTSHSALTDLLNAYIPKYASKDACVELSIRIADEDLSIRDMSAFLELADSIYGRLSENGLSSYARKEHGHLTIDALRRGSWELLLREAISNGSPHSLIVIFLVIKYLPVATQSLATAYNQVEQGLLARANRKRIQTEMAQDNNLSSLSVERRRQLSELIEYMQDKERSKLHRAIRFVRNRLLSIDIKIGCVGNAKKS